MLWMVFLSLCSMSEFDSVFFELLVECISQVSQCHDKASH
jgi:hypothetical protein